MKNIKIAPAFNFTIFVYNSEQLRGDPLGIPTVHQAAWTLTNTFSHVIRCGWGGNGQTRRRTVAAYNPIKLL